MKLARDKVCTLIEIRKPRWKQRVVGIASFRVGEHNEIRILATGKDGKKYYPDNYYMSGDDIRSYPTQDLPSGVRLHLVPISDLEILERI